MDLSVIGINHHTAPVEVRERFALTGELAGRFLRTVHGESMLEEALVIDTCNRTEIYFVSRAETDATAHVLEHIGRLKGEALQDDAGAFYRHDGPAAVAHLFRVAAALDSQVVGEHEVLGQVRAAYHQALEARTAGFLLNKLLHAALRVGKRTRSETQIGRGSASVAQTAVDLAGQVFADLGDKTVLVVGAGQTAETAARRLLAPGVGRLIVANRTLERAEHLAEQLGREPDEADEPAPAGQCPARSRRRSKNRDSHLFPPSRPSSSDGTVPEKGKEVTVPVFAPQTRAIELTEIPAVLDDVDLVICSTGSPEPVLTMASVGPSIRKRSRLLLIVDIAVPRDVEPAIGEMPNVFLYNLNDLDRVVAQNIQRRRQEIPRAEAIVDQEVARFVAWHDSRQAAATIALLQRRFDMLREAEIKRYGSKFTEDDRAQLDPFTKGLCSKMLHRPIAYLKELAEQARTSDQLAAVDTIRRMFNLDELDEEAQ